MYIKGTISVLMIHYRCIIELCHWYTWFTLIAYKIYINTPLLSHSDTPSFGMLSLIIKKKKFFLIRHSINFFKVLK